MRLFKKSILKGLIKEVKSIVTDRIFTSINADLKKHTHFQTAGLGFDVSASRKPMVTDNNMLSLFMNGTFYSDAAQALGQVSKTQHPRFEVGNASRQDLMIHMPDTVVTSLFVALSA